MSADKSSQLFLKIPDCLKPPHSRSILLSKKTRPGGSPLRLPMKEENGSAVWGPGLPAGYDEVVPGTGVLHGFHAEAG